MSISETHLARLFRACVREQPLAQTVVSALFFAFALVEVVLGFQDNCNCLVLSGFLHACYVLDLVTQWLPRFYPAVKDAPEGFNRIHLLVRLTNLYMIVFLCVDCIVEAVVDFRKYTNMRPTTVPIILGASLVLHFLSKSIGKDNDTPFDPASTALLDSATNGSSTPSRESPNDGASSSVPAKVGSISFFVFAVIQYLIPHEQPTRWADSVVTFVAAIAVIARASPHLRNYTLFFMQASSRHKRGAASACLQKIESLPGVIECVCTTSIMSPRPYLTSQPIGMFSGITLNDFGLQFPEHMLPASAFGSR